MSYTGTDPYGVRATAGTLITCDSAAKQIIMHLDKQRPGSDKFILNDFRESESASETRRLGDEGESGCRRERERREKRKERKERWGMREGAGEWVGLRIGGRMRDWEDVDEDEGEDEDEDAEGGGDEDVGRDRSDGSGGGGGRDEDHLRPGEHSEEDYSVREGVGVDERGNEDRTAAARDEEEDGESDPTSPSSWTTVNEARHKTVMRTRTRHAHEGRGADISRRHSRARQDGVCRSIAGGGAG